MIFLWHDLGAFEISCVQKKILHHVVEDFLFPAEDIYQELQCVAHCCTVSTHPSFFIT
mgnify:CR=1 FL=1